MNVSSALSISRKINKIILEELDFDVVVQKIADFVPTELEFATGILAIYDKKTGVLKRIAASKTKGAEEAIQALHRPFKSIEIPVTDPDNMMAKAFRERKHLITTRVYDVLRPIVSEAEADQIQAIMGTKTTLIYPIFMKNDIIGIFLASTQKSQEELSPEDLEIINIFVDGTGIALQHAMLYKNLRENAAELTELNQKLKVLDRLKDEFVSLASHELRTPMTAIKSYLWLFLEDNKQTLNYQQRMYVERAYLSTERLINLVNDMLNVSRIESGRLIINKCPTDIVHLTEEVVSEMAPAAAEQKKTLTFTPPVSALPPTDCDPEKIKQVLTNLIGNSLKFTQDGGVISVSIKAGNGVVSVSVQDNGKGISPQDMGKLFKKFGIVGSTSVLTHGAQSTGLGLYISKSIVELNHGTIWVESQGEGKGSTFSFSLPLSKAQVTSPTISQGQPNMPLPRAASQQGSSVI